VTRAMTLSTSAHLERVTRDGYTIVEGAIAPDLIEALNGALERLERDLKIGASHNAFEGERTVRIYNLLATARRSPSPRPRLGPADRRRRAGRRRAHFIAVVHRHRSGRDRPADPCRRSGHPAGKAAPADHLQRDVGPHRLHRENGATRLVPGSHRKESPRYGGAYRTIPAEMARVRC